MASLAAAEGARRRQLAACAGVSDRFEGIIPDRRGTGVPARRSLDDLRSAPSSGLAGPS
jgi:hypothetical protein